MMNFKIIPEDKAIGLLLQPVDASFPVSPDTGDAIYSLRIHADGYRLQGGNDQLDRALSMYTRVADALIARLHLATESWHRRETSLCKFGMGMVYAGIKLYKSAEQYALQAMLLLHATGPLDDADKCQLLDMATSLAKDVYLNPPEYPYQSSSSIRQAEKAWHVLAWCLAYIVQDVQHPALYDTMMTPTAASDGHGNRSNSVDNDLIVSIYAMLSSGPALSMFTQLAEAVRNRYRKAVDSLYKVVVQLGQHELAVQMYKTIIDKVDVAYAFAPVDVSALDMFYPLRLTCVRRVLGLCDVLASTAASDAATSQQLSAWFDFAFSQVRVQGGRVHATECELWGDLLRLCGDPASALCLYAACSHSQRGSVTRHMKRLSGKMNRLMENQEVS